jgi:hypothetical protein
MGGGYRPRWVTAGVRLRGAMRLRRWKAPSIAVLLIAVGGCGGGQDGDGAPPGVVRTFVYAPMECREDADKRTFRQELRIQQNEGPVVTVEAASTVATQQHPVFPGACGFAASSRSGLAAVFAGGIQRLGVSPDGSLIVFERTNRFSILRLPALDADQEGFFAMRADGTGLRPLGLASKNSITRFTSLKLWIDIVSLVLPFRADGGAVVFTDQGPGPNGEDATQVFTIDVATGERFQVTHLPRGTPADHPDPLHRDVIGPAFELNGRIGFTSSVDVDGWNPNGEDRLYDVNADGTDLKHQPYPGSLPGTALGSTFLITGSRLIAWPLNFYGEAPGFPNATEIWAFDRDGNGLQLTNFGRLDTGGGVRADADAGRVLFTASVDPRGANSSESCQIFSIDRLGTDLRQLTSFNQAGLSASGCGFLDGVHFQSPPDCTITDLRLDEVTRAVLFASSCDVFGDNPYGEQIFAMNPDGTNLRQLTHVRGFTEANGVVEVELPGPFASSAQPR